LEKTPISDAYKDVNGVKLLTHLLISYTNAIYFTQDYLFSTARTTSLVQILFFYNYQQASPITS